MSKEAVILLHGLARTKRSMQSLANNLQQAGYFIVNHAYASRADKVEVLSNREIPVALEKCPQEIERIHFVTHSLGGILLRRYLLDHKISKISRSVMLGPPNQGSEIVDKLGHLKLFELINGAAGLQLGTAANKHAECLSDSLGDWPSHAGELGVIAGRYSVNLFLSTLIPGADDGKVSVESSKLAGMTDHLVMPTTHTFMMSSPHVLKQVQAFLAQGEFER